MNTPQIVYHIDPSHRIIFVNEEWDRFARSNSGEKFTSDKVIGLVIWDFISDPATESIYRELLQTISPGNPVSFTFRCDAPDRKRQLRMIIRLLEDRIVEFSTETLSVTLASQKHLSAYLPGTRSGEILHVCSWCKKIRSDAGWLEIESALNESRLFEQERMPDLSHGICEDCYSEMKSSIARRIGGEDAKNPKVSTTW